MTQTVYARLVQGQTGLAATLRSGLPTALVATAASVTEQAGGDPDPGLYAIVFSTLVAAGTYTLPITKSGTVYATRTVTLTGVDGETAVAVGEAVVLDSASRLAIWNTLTTETFTADSFGELLLISDGTNGREVKVTGANHIAADVHEVQPDGLTNSTEISAINTFAARVTTGLVADGAVYQFTANMLELGPSGGGGSSVNVLPATGIVSDRSAGTTLLPVVGETISQSITVYQSDGTTAVSLSGKTLKVIFETMSGVDVAVVAAADITISGTSSNVVTFAYPSAVTASERTLRFAIRDAAAPLTMYLQGVCSVVAAPKVDA